MSHRPGRPGTGGRQPLANPHTFTSATADLIAERGHPHRERINGGAVLTWVDDPVGEGIIAGRLSNRDVQQGETALGQVHPARELCEDLGLSARLIVLTTNNSGVPDFEERSDFSVIAEAIEAGWCKWVMWRDVDRIARDPMPAEAFLRLLRQHNVELYLTCFGRPMRWDEDRLQIRTRVVHSAEELEGIKRRTHDALEARWLKEGRGWPGAKRFGFRRNEFTKFLEVDPDQWEFVKRIHFGYAKLADGERNGVRALRDQLRELGCDLSEPRIRRILADSIYVDGSWSVRHQGQRYPCRTIQLTEPIPATVFQHKQELLGQRRGKQTTTPPGYFCLNAIPVSHDRCAGARDVHNRLSSLRGFFHRGRPGARYRHSPWVPRSCRGLVIAQRNLEEPVLRALLGIASHPVLLEEWRRAERLGDPAMRQELMSMAEAEEAHHRLAALQRQSARLARRFRDRLAHGETIDERDFHQMIDGVRAEIDELLRRLAERQADFDLGRPSARARADAQGLRRALAAVLTPEVPSDAPLRTQRAALVQAAVDDVMVHDREQGSVAVEVRTPLGVETAGEV